MQAPSLCVLLPGADPSLERGSLFDIRRYGFDAVLLVDHANPDDVSAALPGLEVGHVTSTALVEALEARSRQPGIIMLIGQGRATGRFNWLDLVPRLASRPASSAAVAFGSDEPERPIAALIRREAIGSLEPFKPLAALAKRADTFVMHYEGAEPSSSDVRPAVFFDRDGVINADHGYVGDVSRFAFLPDAIAGVKAANDRGALAFLVTNQSGVARGCYSEQDVVALHRHMTHEMRRQGAHFDDIRTCPHLPDAAVAAYRLACRCRKPEPGMLLDLMQHWPIDRTRSIMVGDKDSDMQAARAAGLTGMLYEGGSLADLVIASLTQDDRPVGRNKAS